MSHVKHATIGSLVASLMGAALGFLLWARQLDNNGANRGVMRLIGWMGLGLVTVSVAIACLSIAFLQYSWPASGSREPPRRAVAVASVSPAPRSDRAGAARIARAGRPSRARSGPPSGSGHEPSERQRLDQNGASSDVTTTATS